MDKAHTTQHKFNPYKKTIIGGETRVWGTLCSWRSTSKIGRISFSHPATEIRRLRNIIHKMIILNPL